MHKTKFSKGHNPCFIRLCFAIEIFEELNFNEETSHNPCFIRLCFAIYKYGCRVAEGESHNPCFIRLCFAISIMNGLLSIVTLVTILVLLDYVLQ